MGIYWSRAYNYRLSAKAAVSKIRHSIMSKSKNTEQKHAFEAGVDELEVGIRAVAAPIFDHEKNVKAALSIGGPASRMSTRIG